MKALCSIVIVMILVLIYFNLPSRPKNNVLVVEVDDSDPRLDFRGRVTPLVPPKCWSLADRVNEAEVSFSNGRCDVLLPGGGSLFYAGDPLLSRQKTEEGQEYQAF